MLPATPWSYANLVHHFIARFNNGFCHCIAALRSLGMRALRHILSNIFLAWDCFLVRSRGFYHGYFSLPVQVSQTPFIPNDANMAPFAASSRLAGYENEIKV
jgi:hypothetical protein